MKKNARIRSKINSPALHSAKFHSPEPLPFVHGASVVMNVIEFVNASISSQCSLCEATPVNGLSIRI
jgi:hypothetical protein